MKNRKEKNRFSFIGVFMLMVVLLAGILTGGIAEIRSTYEKTSVYTVETVAGKGTIFITGEITSTANVV